jgi:hypothetical protein
MPTINEVWEQALQINANLAILHNDQIDLKNCCNTSVQRLQVDLADTTETNDWLEELRSVMAAGFTAMAAGFAGMHQRQDLTNQLLWMHTQQHQTMICILEKISRNTCALLNESTRQTQFQDQITDSVQGLDHMFATVHPDASLVRQREEEQRLAIERCCPPDQPQDPCSYEECPAPSPTEPRPVARYEGFIAPPSQVVRTGRHR